MNLEENVPGLAPLGVRVSSVFMWLSGIGGIIATFVGLYATFFVFTLLHAFSNHQTTTKATVYFGLDAFLLFVTALLNLIYARSVRRGQYYSTRNFAIVGLIINLIGLGVEFYVLSWPAAFFVANIIICAYLLFVKNSLKSQSATNI